jgi:hypothetical protein
MSRVVVFVDILGARYLPHKDLALYRRNLGLFQSAVVDNASRLGKDGSLFCFNDSAYAEAEEPTALIEFLRSIRRELFKHQVYVKGAVAEGALEARLFSGRGKQTKITGASFGEAAGRVFALADKMKGIGFLFDEPLVADLTSRGYLVRTCHSPGATRRSIDCISDLRFVDDELDSGVFKNTLIECLRVNSEKQLGGRYFVTYIVSLIRSLDWTTIGTGSNEGGDQVVEMLMGGWFETHFSDLIGMECVYGALLDEVFSKAGDNAPITQNVFRYLGKMRRIGSKLALVPECLLRRHIRNTFLAFQLEYVRELKQKALQRREEAKRRREETKRRREEAKGQKEEVNGQKGSEEKKTGQKGSAPRQKS